MEYSKLVAVSGLPGLYELISSKNDGAIVRSLDDKSTKFASSRIHQFSHLESIEIYTTHDNVNLVDVFLAMEKAGGSLPDVKDNAAIKKYFEGAYPDMDFDRVYASDMKKMVKWFEILQKNKVEIKLSEPEAEEAEEEEAVAVEEEKPVKKAAAKKKEEAPAEDAAEEKPAKKTAAKKAAKTEEEGEEKPAKKPAAKKAAKKKAE